MLLVRIAAKRTTRRIECFIVSHNVTTNHHPHDQTNLRKDRFNRIL